MKQDNKYEVSMQVHPGFYLHRKKTPGGIIESHNKVENNRIMIFQKHTASQFTTII
jgi:hypothetical protein